MEGIKVVLVGEAGVGKTSIINRFTKEQFNEEEMSSLNAQFISKTINVDDKSIKFDIWDTAGQEKFRAITKLFYKDTQVICLVYEITNKNSFEEIKKYWYKESIENSNAKYFFVVANKSDLYENEQVTDEEGKKFAKQIKGIFKSTSALSNNGISRLFDSIGRKMLNPSYTEEEGVEIKNNNINNNNSNKNEMYLNENNRNSIKLNKTTNKKKNKIKCCNKV